MISDKGWRIFKILMIVFAVLVFFNFPIGFSGKDYTSTIFSLSGSYYIRTFYDRPVDLRIGVYEEISYLLDLYLRNRKIIFR